MAITFNFLANNLNALIADNREFPTKAAISSAFTRKDTSEIAKLICLIANEIRARSSTLAFPERHQLGFDPPSRKLGGATKYLDEIGRAVGGNPVDAEFSQPTFDEFGWHAFGAAIEAIAGLLEHLEQVQKP